MNNLPISAAIKSLVFPGNAIIAGKSADGNTAITAYFICGLNSQSRGRVFVEDGGGVSEKPFVGEGALTQPVVSFENRLFIGNGDHTDKLCSAYASGMGIRDELGKLDCVLPDLPRISAVVKVSDDDVEILMHTIKQTENALVRQSFEYSGIKRGTGYLLTALSGSEYPFEPVHGEPVPIEISGSIFDVVADIWENLRPESRVSLWVKATDLSTRKSISRIINRNR